MISNVIIENGVVMVFNEDNLLLSQIYKPQNELAAFGLHYYVMYNNENGTIEVYDADTFLISSMQIGSKKVIGMIEDTITVKDNINIVCYDVNCIILFHYNLVAAVAILKQQALTSLKNDLFKNKKNLNNLKTILIKLKSYDIAADLTLLTSSIEKLIECCNN